MYELVILNQIVYERSNKMKRQVPMAERPEEKKRRESKEKRSNFFAILFCIAVIIAISAWIWIYILTQAPF